MTKIDILKKYWIIMEQRDISVKQEMYDFFHANAKIYLHDTNELLTREELIDYNFEFDQEWYVAIDRIDELVNGQFVTITFHRSKNWIRFITSFFTFTHDKISELHEYYAQCDEIPQWRTDLTDNEKIKS